jgi:ATP-dependent RNA helicase DeaD
METKKQRIIKELKNLFQNNFLNNFKEYNETIKAHFSDIENETLSAFLLKYILEKEIDLTGYSQVKKIRKKYDAGVRIQKSQTKTKSSRKGEYRDKYEIELDKNTRLFITIGKKDRITLKKLLDFLETETGVAKHKIQDINIFDNFSFVTVPFKDAEVILQKFKNKDNKHKITIQKAKKRKR